MKRLFLLLALFGVLATGCEELSPTEQTPNITTVFNIDGEDDYIISAEGAEITVMVTTNIDYSVVIPEDAKDWLSVTTTRSETREEMLAFVVAANDTFEERRAEVELVDANGEALETISFIQDGQSKIFDIDSEDFYIFEPEGSSVTIDVTTNLEYSVVIDQDVQSCLSVADTRATLREETLTFTAAPNDTDNIRYAFVELIDADNNVLQEIPFIQNAITQSDSSCPNDEIWYTNGSTTEATTPYATDVFGANIVSNTYDAAKECWVIKFDDKVTTIGDWAFGYCGSLTSVTIGDSVTTIGVGAFGDCSSLTSVTIPDSVTTIGYNAFYWCHSLTSVYISDISAWCNISFSDLGSNPLSNGCNLYLNNELVTDLTIPDSVTTIGERAFGGCSSLTSVTIPDSVTTIGGQAFSSCSSLTSVTIPDSVTEIGDEAFCWCESLTNITIPDSVTEIGYEAFAYCSSLTSITIPDSVTSIGNSAFYWCESLTSVYCKPTTPPAALFYEEGWYAFYNNAPDRKIYVPMESVEAYKSASYWSDYASVIVGYDF